ncbi:MAG: thioredoxin domain-containing protein [Myxococcales bacterium]|nr:thioredoxin domain-containing protein [Myxococcales bacterium]
MSNGTAIISILIAFGGGVLVGNLTSKGSGEEIAGIEGEAAAVPGAAAAMGEDIERVKAPVTDAQPTKGPKDALVTIVEISDFECPFCSRVNPTISKIMKEYEGKVRVAWRNNPLPFHRSAPLAHQAAMEAFEQGGSDKFWKMHDKLFANQKALGREDLEKYAQEIGLDMAKFKKALDTNAHKATVDDDQALAAKIGARGTPHFVINGRKLSGAQPFENFKAIIDDEITRANDLIKKGVAKGALYATIMANAADAPAPEKPADAPEARPQPDPNAVYKVPVGDEPTKGPKDALVTIVEVSDFECPFCSRVGPTIAQIEKEYGKDVRIVWFNNPLPFHQNAPAAHQAALEAYAQGGDAKFWKMHDKLFENQKALTRENLETWAKELGLNMAKFKAALDNGTHKARVDADVEAIAKAGARIGTPSFFINGNLVQGAQPFEAFKAVIDAELKK